ncbi:MAG: hypothetical protein ACMUHY_02375 [Thermoplasmatota archaeon]
MVRANDLLAEMSNFYFTPELHGVPISIKLLDVLRLINNPFFKTLIVKLYFEKRSFDLVDTIKTFEMLEKETSIYNLFDKVDIFQNSRGMPDFVHSFMEATMIGIEEDERDLGRTGNSLKTEVLLLEADMKAVRGRFEEALSLYDSILRKPNLPQDLWFIANIGRIKTFGRMGKRDKWQKVLEDTRKATTNKIAHGFLNQIEADLLGILGEYDEANLLFEKAIGTFRFYNNPVFLSIAFNNYGILMFNREIYEEAERLWKKAKKYASQSGSMYIEANIITNLASIMRVKGDLKKAKKYLKNVEKTYESLNNLESLSVVEYNMALILLAEGEIEKAMALFNRSCFVTFPLLSEAHREERFIVFKREAEKLKYTPLRKGPKYDLIYME